jgi:hypothetical protein
MATVKTEPKKKRGRPVVYAEPMARSSFRVPAGTLEALKKISGGNVTRAIIHLVDLWTESQELHP